MEPLQPIDKLSEAAALLTMLERLVAELSRWNEPDSGIPWEGIRLTLQQSREIVQNTKQELISNPAPPEIKELAADPLSPGLKNPADSRLASRIRRVSTFAKRSGGV